MISLFEYTLIGSQKHYQVEYRTDNITKEIQNFFWMRVYSKFDVWNGEDFVLRCKLSKDFKHRAEYLENILGRVDAELCKYERGIDHEELIVCEYRDFGEVDMRALNMLYNNRRPVFSKNAGYFHTKKQDLTKNGLFEEGI